MFDEIPTHQDRQGGQPQPIGEILAKLVAHLERRFPDALITLVNVPVTEDETCLC